MRVKVLCTKHELPVLCMPVERKTKSIFPKWYCFNCHRYVLPDGKYHFSMPNEEKK